MSYNDELFAAIKRQFPGGATSGRTDRRLAWAASQGVQEDIDEAEALIDPLEPRIMERKLNRHSSTGSSHGKAKRRIYHNGSPHPQRKRPDLPGGGLPPFRRKP